jgi:mono/diheme cytochrome c family protein
MSATGIAHPEPERASLWLLGAVAILAFSAACNKSTSPAPESQAVADGRRAFMANCASCHNTDPNLDGSVGPAIAGSSRALVEARVLHQSYPPGYKPKRATHLMRPLPWLAPKIGDLTAFLDAAKKNQK